MENLVSAALLPKASANPSAQRKAKMNDRIPGTTWSNPIWYRDRWRIYISGMDYPGLEYEYMHDDYDGDSDTENRAGHCESIEACKQEIHDRFYSRDGK